MLTIRENDKEDIAKVISETANDPTKSEQYDVFLVPEFSLLTFSAIVEPLRLANWVAGRSLYSWKLISTDGKECLASNGIKIAVSGSINSPTSSKTVIVCASLRAEKFRNKAVLAWLRQLARKNVRIGGVGAGAYLLARAGILKGGKCALHWEESDAFQNEFPRIELSKTLYEISPSYFTCAGGIAVVDLMLNLIAQRHGSKFSSQIAEQFVSSGARPGTVFQKMSPKERTGVLDRRILSAIQIIEANLEDPLPLSDLCRAAGISARHLQRLFSEHFNCSPKRYYLHARLQHARLRLTHTDDSLLGIAVSSGFPTASHFCNEYRRFYGHTPKFERNSIRLNSKNVAHQSRPI